MIAIGRILIMIGIGITILGVALWLGGRYFPWLGNLPGDFRYESDNVKVYFPLTTMIIISIIGTILLNIIIRLLNR